jgi:outer membrane receptor protein involved in Fe transport
MTMVLIGQMGAAESPPSVLRDYRIARGPLCDALDQFQRQSGLDILYSEGWCTSKHEACEVSGRMTAKKALSQLLCNMQEVKPSWLANSVSLYGPEVPKMPEHDTFAGEVTVSARRNPDLAPSKSAPIERIELSPQNLPFGTALSAGDYLARQLTSDVPLPARVGAEEITSGGRTFNLRGMGQARTIILVDGRRPALIDLGGQPRQPDLDLFSPEMVDHFEIVTVPGAGPGGGEAGTINVIRRRTGDGTRLTASTGKYSGMSGGPRRLAIEHWGGLGSNGGAFALQGSVLEEDGINAGDWSGLVEGKKWVWLHNPKMIERAPPSGAMPNIRSEDGEKNLSVCGSPLLTMSSTWRPGMPVSELCLHAGEYSFDLGDNAGALGGALATVRAAHRATSLDASMSLPLNSWLEASADLAYAHSARKGVVSTTDELPRTVSLEADDPDNPFGERVVLNSPYPLAYGEMTRDHTSGSAWAGLTAELESVGSVSFEYSHAWADARITRPIFAEDMANRSTTELLLGLPPASGVRLTTQSTPRFRSNVDEFASRLRIPFGEHREQDGELLLNIVRRDERLANVRLFDADLVPGQTSLPGEDPGRRSQVVNSVQSAIRKPLFENFFSSRPVVGELNVRYDSWRLELSPEPAGDRRYGRVGGAGALSWKFTENWLVRGAYTESYFPPSVMQLIEGTPIDGDFSDVPDPRHPGQMLGNARLRVGGNLSLRPERVRAYTAGLSFERSRFDASAQFLRIDRSDLIAGTEVLLLGNDLSFLSVRPDLISESADRIVVDGRAQNIDQQRQESVDLTLGTHMPLAGGTFRVRAAGTWTPTFRQRATPSAQETNDANVGNLAPPRYRAYWGFEWGWRSILSIGFTSRWVGETEVSRDSWIRANQGGDTVSAQIYHDLFVSYTTQLRGALEGPLQIRLDGRNVFRASPPFDAGEFGYWSRYGLEEAPVWRITLQYLIGGLHG